MNVNFGEKRGMKRLLQHAVPFAVWIGCGNHKVALCFKDLLQIFFTDGIFFTTDL